METIIDILVARDGITTEAAWNLVEGCKQEINDVLYSDNSPYAVYDAVATIIQDWLGLEPDYIDYFLD